MAQDSDSLINSIRNDAIRDTNYVSFLIRSMDPRDFEDLILLILSKLGYEVRPTPPTGDMGIDGFAEKDGFKIIIQAKRYNNSVPFQYLQQFYGALEHEKADQGIFATSSSITKQGKEFIDGKPIVAWDLRKISEHTSAYINGNEFPGGLSIEHFHKFNSKYIREGVSCPRCDNGKVVKRKRRSDGKPFYGCSNFPSCNYLLDIKLGYQREIVCNTNHPITQDKQQTSIAVSDPQKQPVSLPTPAIPPKAKSPEKTEFNWLFWLIIANAIVILLAIIKRDMH